MIVAERKPIPELVELLDPYEKILVAGCGGCMTACSAGGRKEVEIMATALLAAFARQGKKKDFVQQTVVRQCEPEFAQQMAENVKAANAVLSLACGAGVDFVAEKFPDAVVVPGVNTKFIGATESVGVWLERCAGCGNCILGKTAGLCPVARCPKSMINGPCSGVRENGKCEARAKEDCIWVKICERLKKRNALPTLLEIIEPMDWSRSFSGRPRRMVREDLTV